MGFKCIKWLQNHFFCAPKTQEVSHTSANQHRSVFMQQYGWTHRVQRKYGILWTKLYFDYGVYSYKHLKGLTESCDSSNGK